MNEPQSSHWALAAASIAKSYGPTLVLAGANLHVAAGEIHALLGGNGAGKSTLIRIISGSVRRDGGSIEIEGNAGYAPGAVAVVFQELALLPDLTVAENIHLPNRRGAFGLMRHGATEAAAIDALRQIDPDLIGHLGTLVRDLDLHKRQLVEIARALSSGARIILLDEPTANLTLAETEGLFRILRRLAEGGIAILLVSHRMNEIRAVSDVCTILRDGRSVVERRPVSNISDDEIVRAMMGDIRERAAREEHVVAGGPPALSLRRKDMQIDLPAGAILGLAGAPEGPATLMNELIGVDPDAGWSVELDGQALQAASPAAAIAAGVGYVSGDRAEKGIIATLPILDNITAAMRVARRRRLVRRDEIDSAMAALEALSIKASSLDALPQTLSGGTQQKLLIARWLDLAPRILVLEEPTRGVDIGTKRDIYAIIRSVAASGTIIVWWSTEFAELAEICGSVLTFDLKGGVSKYLTGKDVSELMIAEATGMAA